MSVNKYLQQITGAFRQIAYSDVSGTPTIPSTLPTLAYLTSSLGSNVSLSTTGVFDGPSVSQGSSGTWLATGQLTVGSTGTFFWYAKLWDGTTVIDSGYGSAVQELAGAGVSDISIPLSGVLASPAGNIKMSVAVSAAGSGIIANNSGFGKDTTLTVVRIG